MNTKIILLIIITILLLPFYFKSRDEKRDQIYYLMEQQGYSDITLRSTVFTTCGGYIRRRHSMSYNYDAWHYDHHCTGTVTNNYGTVYICPD